MCFYLKKNTVMTLSIFFFFSFYRLFSPNKLIVYLLSSNKNSSHHFCMSSLNILCPSVCIQSAHSNEKRVHPGFSFSIKKILSIDPHSFGQSFHGPLLKGATTNLLHYNSTLHSIKLVTVNNNLNYDVTILITNYFITKLLQ